MHQNDIIAVAPSRIRFPTPGAAVGREHRCNQPLCRWRALVAVPGDGRQRPKPRSPGLRVLYRPLTPSYILPRLGSFVENGEHNVIHVLCQLFKQASISSDLHLTSGSLFSLSFPI